jgi:hypothetical protein
MSRRVGLKIKETPKVEPKKEEVKEQPKKELKEVKEEK